MFEIFLPDLLLNSVHEITPELLAARGVRAMILDLDDTLSPTHTLLPETDVIDWARGMSAAGVKLLVLSNNGSRRVSAYCAPLGIPFITRAKKPFSGGFRRALAVIGESPAHTAVVGDQLLTDVWGGNRLGMFTIAVAPAGKGAAATVKIKRILERPLWRIYRKINRGTSG